MIVRQSSLSNAVATLALASSNNTQGNPNEVINLAKQYEKYVLGTNQEESNLDDFSSDIPF